MEDIYTVKVRTNPDPRALYPSERRYSASTVLGLGIVHLALAVTTLLLASLSLSTLKPHAKGSLIDNVAVVNSEDTFLKVNNLTEISDIESRDDDMAFLDDDTETPKYNARPQEEIDMESDYNSFTSLTLAPCLMSLGAFTAGITGLLAWKRWYIDHNIRWFFFMSTVSVITSLICLTVITLTVHSVREQQGDFVQSRNMFIFSFSNNNVVIDKLQNPGEANVQSLQSKIFSKSSGNKTPNLRLVLAINILIASVLEFAWSIISAKLAFYGMKNDYPDDIILSRGKIEVSTIHKGNKINKVVAPDILDHHPKKSKLVKYFPKKENGFLPKLESNNEYRDRVNKFLSSNANITTD